MCYTFFGRLITTSYCFFGMSLTNSILTRVDYLQFFRNFNKLREREREREKERQRERFQFSWLKKQVLREYYNLSTVYLFNINNSGCFAIKCFSSPLT